MSNTVHLAHRIAAGFLEQAALFAQKVGPENLAEAMEAALANLETEVLGGIGDPSADPERRTILLACSIAKATLTADTRTVN